MQHTCYHVLADKHNEFFTNIQDVKSKIIDWQNHGEGHIKVFKIVTEDLDTDSILLNENVVHLEENNVS
ncbi:MAG: hypothetical protein H6613_13460 [Ignavibacteriales bacterium]|nr:hypothetical protein [Ignavibacteriales bacterium]